MSKLEENKNVVEEIFKELSGKIGLEVSYEVVVDEENEAIKIEIEAGDQAGLLIGNRGETLYSLQTVIGMIVMNKIGEWVRIIINVDDWRDRQEERLEGLATQTAERALETGEEQRLYNLKASQRRIIHMALKENKKVETESSGEGRDRYLVIRPKKK
ncbi:KH domain-containing protein [Candidatus Woesebacteria bacterium]|nr:KH domain-containing protein [Candidatus Woesebacteria bacterium]